MSEFDVINALFEGFGGCAVLLSVWRALKLKVIMGVHWFTPTFFWLWSSWNLLWYWHLAQPISLAAAMFALAAATLWMGAVFKLTRNGQ